MVWCGSVKVWHICGVAVCYVLCIRTACGAAMSSDALRMWKGEMGEKGKGGREKEERKGTGE